MRFFVRERALRIKDDFLVLDDHKEEVFEVKAKFFHIADHFKIYDKKTGDMLLEIKQKILAYTRQYEIIQNGISVATVRKVPEEVSPGDNFEINSSNGMVFHIQGDFKEWDFNVVDHYGRLLGHITREFAIFSDHYTVDVAQGVDALFIIALSVILDEVREDEGRGKH